MEDNILDKLWVSRNPDIVLFLEIINECEREEYDTYIIYKKKREIYLNYSKFTKNLWLYQKFIDLYLDKSYEQLILLLIDLFKIYLNIEVKQIITNRDIINIMIKKGYLTKPTI